MKKIINCIIFIILLISAQNYKKNYIESCAIKYISIIEKQSFNDGYYNVSDLNKIEVNGIKPTNNSWLKIEKGIVSDYSLKFNEYVVNYDIETRKPIILKGEITWTIDK